MKKRKLIICCCILIMFVILTTFLKSNSKEKTFAKNGVIYALQVNGKTVDSFPEKGLYEVTTACENADSRWDYENWKLYIENITGEVSCKISFDESEINKLNEYVIGLAGTNQGKGKLIHEIDNIADYTNSVTISLINYENTEQFYNSFYTYLEGTKISNVFSFDNNVWATNSNNMLSGNYYHMSFEISGEGNYQLCYELSKGSTSNHVYILRENVLIDSKAALASEMISGCTDLGYVSKRTAIRVVQNAYSSISTLKFSIKKGQAGEQVDTGYRYEGKNPNNYIWFNNELWRIIGVFDSETHGVANTNLTKIIRANSIGNLEKDSSYKMLNGAYLNKQDGTSSEYCLGYEGIKSNCDYRIIGIDDNHRRMIKESKWYLDLISDVSSYHNISSDRPLLKYKAERNAESTLRFISQMYKSDYGYGPLETDICSRNLVINKQSTDNCAGQNWLYYGYYFDLRPTLYLNENVYTYAGDGSINNPYIIGMDEVSE